MEKADGVCKPRRSVFSGLLRRVAALRCSSPPHIQGAPFSAQSHRAKGGRPQTHPRQRYNGGQMPRGLVRFQQCGVFHFITFSCYRRQPLLTNRAGYAVFEQALERVRQRSGMVVAGYVLMPEHVHLLVNEPASGSLASAIQVLKQTVARALKRPEEAHFWQPRYYDFNVHSDAKRIEKLHYMHRTPSSADSSPNPKTGPGPASAITQPATPAPSRSSPDGPHSSAATNYPKQCVIRKRKVKRQPTQWGPCFPTLRAQDARRMGHPALYYVKGGPPAAVSRSRKRPRTRHYLSMCTERVTATSWVRC